MPVYHEFIVVDPAQGCTSLYKETENDFRVVFSENGKSVWLDGITYTFDVHPHGTSYAERINYVTYDFGAADPEPIRANAAAILQRYLNPIRPKYMHVQMGFHQSTGEIAKTMMFEKLLVDDFPVYSDKENTIHGIRYRVRQDGDYVTITTYDCPHRGSGFDWAWDLRMVMLEAVKQA